MRESIGDGRRHRRDVPEPRSAGDEPEVHAAKRRIKQAAQLSADMHQTGGKHRLDDQ